MLKIDLSPQRYLGAQNFFKCTFCFIYVIFFSRARCRLRQVCDLELYLQAEEAKLITELADMNGINCGLFRQAYNASLDVSKFLDHYRMSKLLKEPYDLEGACVIINAGSRGIYPKGACVIILLSLSVFFFSLTLSAFHVPTLFLHILTFEVTVLKPMYVITYISLLNSTKLYELILLL